MQSLNDIAIVGFAYKLPQDLEDDAAFWETLRNARNLSSKWPENRMRSNAHPDPRNGPTHSCGGHFIQQDPAGFDAPLFGITAKEAASMDPIQRWTLEVSYRAFENAGIPLEELKGSRTAVLSATWTEDYVRMAAMDPDNFDRTSATGVMASIIPNRVSYFFGMQGPSFHVDTACSSGLSAFDIACKLLISGDADAALVTAANLLLEPGVYQMLRNLQMLSPDSTCKSFDSKANGFARGEGVLSFVLKPIASALRDGDMIRAVVRAVASNQDGHTPSLSQPNPVAQEKLIRFVYAKAGLGMGQTRYVEAHGTGTPVGDPIEMKAIGSAFRDSRSAEEPLYVGSVKSNIGHLEGASGLAGVLKAILILEKGVIPPNALFKELNPAIDAEFLRVKVPSRCIPWPSTGTRRVSVNSFGFGGSNTHVILEDALHFLEYHGLQGNHCTASIPATATRINGSANHASTLEKTAERANGITDPNFAPQGSGNSASLANGSLTPNESGQVNGIIRNGTTHNGSAHQAGTPIPNKETASLVDSTGASIHHRLLVFSAFDEKAAQRVLRSYSSWYQASKVSSDPIKLDSSSYMLAVRRSHMRWRSFAVASASEGDHEGLTPDDELGNGKGAVSKSTTGKGILPVKPVRVASDPSLCWVFTGQGAQYANMGWELIGTYAVFEETLKRVDEVYKGLGADWSIFDELRRRENVDKPEYSQPLSTAIQIALVELLRSFGITPKAVVGHSSGEIAAAYAIGALSLTSACKVSYFRGREAGKLRVANSSSPGAMISINLVPDQVADFLSRIQAQGIQEVGIACINSPLNVTLSGPETGIDAVKAQADQEGIFAQKLKTGVAYHSSAMSSVSAEYLSSMGNLEPDGILPIRMWSTVTGKSIAPAKLTNGQYWVDNMISPVRFAAAVGLMASDATNLGITDWVEVGPHPALRRYVQDTLSKDRIYYSTALQRNHSATEKVLELAGTLFCRGHNISLTIVNNQQGIGNRSVPLLVDCPPYPFDHSNKFWAEGRISKGYRLRTPTKGGELGQRAPDWNPLQPRWRNFLSVETHPWIGHHVVSDLVLYPAAAMLISAFEAAQEMVPADKTVAGYFVKEAHFMSPIVVPENSDNRVETMASLRPVKNRPQDKEASWDWFDISIFAYTKESSTWTEAFRANVQVEYVSNAELSGRHMADEAIREQHQGALEACNLPVDAQVLYSDAFEHGLQYGELFRLCQDIKWDKLGARAITTVPVPGHAKYETASFIHPAVLDTMFHALRVSAGQQKAANVPLRLADAWFASTGWPTPGTGSVRWLASSKGRGGKAALGERGSVSALTDKGIMLARIGKLVTAAISREDSDLMDENAGARQKTLLYGIEWKPQLSLLSAAQLSDICKADVFAHDPDTTLTEHRKRTAVLNITAVRHVKNIPGEQRTKLHSTLRQHMDWMEHHVRSLSPEEREAAEALTDSEYEAKLDSFAADFPAWTLYPRVARALPAIMAGEIDPLQVIFESEHAKIFYAALFQPLCGDGRLSRFLNLAAHENPSLRILEVGAGTGGMTVHILNALREREKRTGALSFAEYMYTDITPAFFEAAKEIWDAEGLGSRMLFKTLDMERSVSTQGFNENAYDLVVGGSCVHATKLLSNTLRNLRRLLKPGGKLVLLEMTKPTDITSCFFATLASGWWLSQEEGRVKNKSPLVSDNEWNDLLKQNGFSGNDLVLKDTREGEAHIASIIVSTALEEAKEEIAPLPRRIFVVDPQQDSQKLLADVLSKGEDAVVFLDQLDRTPIENSDIVVSLVEIDNALLANVSETQFSQLQTLLKQIRSLVWVTAPQDGVNDTHFPHYAVAQGFLRTFRAEMPESHVVSLSIEDITSNEMRREIINKIIETAFGASPSPELEYVFRSGQIHTARAVENISANNTLRSLLYPRPQKITWENTPAVKLALGSLGSLESLRFEQDDRHVEILGSCDIEIEAKSWGLSRRDVLTALGRADDDYGGDDFGTDCSGVVTRIGQNCDAQGPKPGDRVVMLTRGCLSKFPRAHETRVIKIPSGSDAMSFETAAAALEPTLTAYRALIDVARVYQGDKVLVHEGASAAGQMAVQIAKKEGAEVFVTTCASSLEGEEEEKRLLVTTLGIAPERIFSASHNTNSFVAGIKRATDGYGVDVIVNTLAGDQLQANWELLGPGGRFVDINPGGGTPLPSTGSLARNTSYAAVDVLYLPPHVTTRLLKDTVTLLDGGEVTPPAPVRLFPATEVKEAFTTLQNGEGSGRVVLVPQSSDVVPQLALDPKALQRCELDGNASYLIPGGLGGLGRSILTWMAAHGAKHLIVPSRSGASAPAAAKLASSLSSNGVQLVTPKCNVANEAELVTLLEDVKQTMPPIRGVINCAMVLPNAVFTNMSFEQWSSAVNTKVEVSFNLHRLLPDQENLDFFIHLASLAGVNGQMASSNYAAGCSFQDALAQRYPGVVTLDIGWMSDVGLIAETAAYQRQLKEWDNMQRIEESELLGVIGMVCGNKRASKEEGGGEGEGEGKGEATGQKQLLVGVRTPADFLSKNQRSLPPVLDRPFLSTFAQHINPAMTSSNKKGTAASGKAVAIDHGGLFRSAADDKTRVSVVTSALTEKLARATTMSVDDVDADRTLSSYGIDSLMAIDIRDWLGREFGAKLSVFEIMSGEKAIKLVAETVVRKSTTRKN